MAGALPAVPPFDSTSEVVGSNPGRSRWERSLSSPRTKNDPHATGLGRSKTHRGFRSWAPFYRGDVGGPVSFLMFAPCFVLFFLLSVLHFCVRLLVFLGCITIWLPVFPRVPLFHPLLVHLGACMN